MLIGVIAEETLLPLVIAPNALFDDFDIVASPWYWLPWYGDRRPTVSVTGFLIPGLVDETALFGDEIVRANYVTNGYLGLWPDPYDDTVPEIFYDFTSGFVPTLQPAPWFELDYIYLPTVPAFPPISPQRYVDPDIFYVPVVYSGTFPDLFVDTDIIRANVIRRDSDPLVLLGEVFNDADKIGRASCRDR